MMVQRCSVCKIFEMLFYDKTYDLFLYILSVNYLFNGIYDYLNLLLNEDYFRDYICFYRRR